MVRQDVVDRCGRVTQHELRWVRFVVDLALKISCSDEHGHPWGAHGISSAYVALWVVTDHINGICAFCAAGGLAYLFVDALLRHAEYAGRGLARADVLKFPVIIFSEHSVKTRTKRALRQSWY